MSLTFIKKVIFQDIFDNLKICLCFYFLGLFKVSRNLTSMEKNCFDHRHLLFCFMTHDLTEAL